MVSDFCTSHSCPKMCAGANYEYKWADGVRYKSPTEVSAPKYVELLMQWVQRQLDDAAIFPTAPNVPFPGNFRETVCNIFRRLFRVYAHIYYSHKERVIELTFEAHLNSCFVRPRRCRHCRRCRHRRRPGSSRPPPPPCGVLTRACPRARLAEALPLLCAGVQIDT